MNTHPTDLNLTSFHIVQFLETITSPSWGNKRGKDPARLLLTQNIWSFSASAHSMGDSNICANSPDASGLIQAVGRHIAEPHLCTSWQQHWQIVQTEVRFIYRKTNNLLTLPSPNVLMLMLSSSIKMQLNNKIKVPILFIFLFLNKLRLEMGCTGFHCYSWHFANIQLWIMDKSFSTVFFLYLEWQIVGIETFPFSIIKGPMYKWQRSVGKKMKNEKFTLWRKWLCSHLISSIDIYMKCSTTCKLTAIFGCHICVVYVCNIIALAWYIKHGIKWNVRKQGFT